MSRVFESCLKSLPQGCFDCVFNGECGEKQLYDKGRADKYQEIVSEYMLLTENQVAEIRVDAIAEVKQKIDALPLYTVGTPCHIKIDIDRVFEELKEQNK